MNISDFINFTADSINYTHFADIIINSWDWLHKADLSCFEVSIATHASNQKPLPDFVKEGIDWASASGLDVTLFRMPLYPILIALSKVLFLQNWPSSIFLLQFSMLIFSGFWLYKLCSALHFSKLGIYTAMIGYLTGLPLVFSFSILTDSLFTSLGVIFICALSLNVISETKKIDHKFALVLSLFFMAFLRETALYFLVSLIPLFFIIYLLRNTKKFFGMLCICFFSIVASQSVIKIWNYHRCGVPVVTTGMVTALTFNLAELVKYKPSILQELWNKSDHVIFLGNSVNYKYKNIIDLEKNIKSDYYKSLAYFPLEHFCLALKEMRHNFIEDCLYLTFNPLHTIECISGSIKNKLEKTLGAPTHIISKKVEDSKYIALDKQISPPLLSYLPPLATVIKKTFMFLKYILNIFSVCLCLFGFYKCARRILDKKFSKETFILGAMILHSASWVFLHALVHLETRYVLTSIVILVILGCAPYPKEAPQAK